MTWLIAQPAWTAVFTSFTSASRRFPSGERRRSAWRAASSDSGVPSTPQTMRSKTRVEAFNSVSMARSCLGPIPGESGPARNLFAGKPPMRLPGLGSRSCFRAADPDPRVHGDATVRGGDHRVQVELDDLVQVVAEAREAVEQIGERVLVRRGLAAKAAH